MINGVLYETENMNEVYPESKARSKFFWERLHYSPRSLMRRLPSE
jgi:hypothetical protein